ncbi:phage nozzle protein, partial [Herbiconiux daphne]
INGWSSEAEGLQKRPATVFKKRLGNAGTFGTQPLIHTINRDLSERYNIEFTGSGVKAYSLGDTIQEITVNVPQGLSYITTTQPRVDLRCITIADYTFIVNRTKVIGKSGRTTDAGNVGGPDRDRVALVLCRGGQYGREMSLTVNGQNFSYRLPDGVAEKPQDAAAMVKETDAQLILTKLVAGIKGKPGLENFTWTIGSGYLHVVAPTGKTISQIEVHDGYAGQILQIVRHEVSTVAKLPIEAPDKYTVLIRGDTTKSGDAYYIRYDAAQKVWKET